MIRFYPLAGVLCALLATHCGCTAFNTVEPRQVLNQTNNRFATEDFVKLNYLQLRQDPPEVYLLGPGDTLGIFIQGVTSGEEAAPPIFYPEDELLPPGIGVPILIRENGRVSLPLVPPVSVSGLTLDEAEQRIRKAYVDRQIFAEGEENIIVSLFRSRKYSIYVIREDATQTGGSTAFAAGQMQPLKLSKYENDVFHALASTGGLPGEDAKNEVVILRGMFDEVKGNPLLMESMKFSEDGCIYFQDLSQSDMLRMTDEKEITRIPLRTSPNQPIPELSQQDIVLQDGDLVLVQARKSDFYYTGGLLGGGKHPLPRDYDLDVFGAIAEAGNPLNVGTSFSQTGTASIGVGAGGVAGGGGGGIGNQVMPPTRVRILRQTGSGRDGQCGQIEIRVSLRRLLRDPSERVIIQPGDIVILEYRPIETIINTGVSIAGYASFGAFGRNNN